MEGLFIFAGVIMIIFGFLQIILFFKLWGMTNNIKEIKNLYFESTTKNAKSDSSKKIDTIGKIEEGELVINIKTGKQMRVIEHNPLTGKYTCYTNGGTVYEGDFDESEIKLIGS